MARRSICLAWAAFVLLVPGVTAQAGPDARYEGPVERYGHFALGRPHEYARITVRNDAGESQSLALPDDEVFEDLAPRPVRLSASGPLEWLTIVSQRGAGARLALVGDVNGKLGITAQSAAIGTPMRWLNPVGVADLDGDGQAEIAAVITPHIGGTLKVYRRDGERLIEVASAFGFSNHVYGSDQLGLAGVIDAERGPRLLVPDRHRTSLRVLRFDGRELVQTASCAVPAPITGAMRVLGPREVALLLDDASTWRVPADCLR